jgi:putative flavoprotein involved in K+ transport
MSPAPAPTPLDVLVIGGGQAGLAMGYHLTQQGRRFDIVDAGPQVGHVWRSRWDSLRLFTSGRYDNLPGLPFPADPDAYPGKDDVATYLEAYASHFQLPVRLNTKVTALTRTDGLYVAKTGEEAVEARRVVIATGPFDVPFTPSIAAQLDPDVHQIHSQNYQRAETLPPGRVLVVGAANSGCQIALELSATHSVDLSVGQRLPSIPQRPLGRDVWSWATSGPGPPPFDWTGSPRTRDSDDACPNGTKSSAPAHGSSLAVTESGLEQGCRRSLVAL